MKFEFTNLEAHAWVNVYDIQANNKLVGHFSDSDGNGTLSFNLTLKEPHLADYGFKLYGTKLDGLDEAFKFTLKTPDSNLDHASINAWGDLQTFLRDPNTNGTFIESLPVNGHPLEVNFNGPRRSGDIARAKGIVTDTAQLDYDINHGKHSTITDLINVGELVNNISDIERFGHIPETGASFDQLIAFYNAYHADTKLGAAVSSLHKIVTNNLNELRDSPIGVDRHFLSVIQHLDAEIEKSVTDHNLLQAYNTNDAAAEKFLAAKRPSLQSGLSMQALWNFDFGSFENLAGYENLIGLYRATLDTGDHGIAARKAVADDPKWNTVSGNLGNLLHVQSIKRTYLDDLAYIKVSAPDLLRPLSANELLNYDFSGALSEAKIGQMFRLLSNPDGNDGYNAIVQQDSHFSALWHNFGYWGALKQQAHDTGNQLGQFSEIKRYMSETQLNEFDLSSFLSTNAGKTIAGYFAQISHRAIQDLIAGDSTLQTILTNYGKLAGKLGVEQKVDILSHSQFAGILSHFDQTNMQDYYDVWHFNWAQFSDPIGSGIISSTLSYAHLAREIIVANERSGGALGRNDARIAELTKNYNLYLNVSSANWRSDLLAISEDAKNFTAWVGDAEHTVQVHITNPGTDLDGFLQSVSDQVSNMFGKIRLVQDRIAQMGQDISTANDDKIDLNWVYFAENNFSSGKGALAFDGELHSYAYVVNQGFTNIFTNFASTFDDIDKTLKFVRSNISRAETANRIGAVLDGIGFIGAMAAGGLGAASSTVAYDLAKSGNKLTLKESLSLYKDWTAFTTVTYNTFRRTWKANTGKLEPTDQVGEIAQVPLKQVSAHVADGLTNSLTAAYGGGIAGKHITLSKQETDARDLFVKTVKNTLIDIAEAIPLDHGHQYTGWEGFPTNVGGVVKWVNHGGYYRYSNDSQHKPAEVIDPNYLFTRWQYFSWSDSRVSGPPGSEGYNGEWVLYGFNEI